MQVIYNSERLHYNSERLHSSSTQLSAVHSPFTQPVPFLVSQRELANLQQQFQYYGAAVLGPAAIEPALFHRLQQESQQQYHDVSWPLQSNGVKNKVNEDTQRAHLGPISQALMQIAGETLVPQVTQQQVEPGWRASCFTYYQRPGQYLGLHTDQKRDCAIALLITVDAQWNTAPGPGLQLHVYEDDTPQNLQIRITSRPNRLIILNGSQRSHQRPPLAPGESVAVMCGCYRRAD